MHARILEQSEEARWDAWILAHPLATVHQTSSWGHFQEKTASRGKYWIVVIEENDRIIGGTMLIRHKLPRNLTWLYATRGPLLDYKSPDLQQHMELLLRAIEPLAFKENAIFLRIDPPISIEHPFPVIKKFRTSPAGFQPQHTLLLDLTLTEEELLAQMKPKGRYNIRLAAKKELIVTSADPKSDHFHKDLNDYHMLVQQTTERDRFYAHRKGFYKTMIEILAPKNLATLYLARHNGTAIAGIIITHFKDTAIYYYGASSNAHRNLMAPYLLQWHAILDAKARGMTHYDFMGIAPEDQPRHPWRGVTEFKEKFGGHPLTFHPAREHSFKPLWHLLYRLHKKFRKRT